jgi:hypothetical protein
MAAHEDKISNNRRKLFKALSTAPVVATLSPGSALATQSAYQCLTKAVDMPPANLYHRIDPGCSNDLCYVYQEKDFWEVPLNTSGGGGGTTEFDTTGWPQAAIDLIGQTIVLAESGIFVTLTGDVVAAELVEVYDNGNLMRIVDGTETLIDAILTQQGLFLTWVEPLGADETPPIAFAGTYPEVQPTGNFQGITGTCLTSILPGATGFTVANG